MNNTIAVQLEDHVIQDIDKNGDDTLRLGFTIAGKTAKVRFPLCGQFEGYQQDVQRLLLMLARVQANIQVTSLDSMSPEEYAMWATITAVALKYKEVPPLVIKICTEYLRLEVDGVKPDQLEVFLEKNLDISHILPLFVSIHSVDDWFKKKAISSLQKIFPKLMQSQSIATSPKKPIAPPPPLEPGVPLDIV